MIELRKDENNRLKWSTFVENTGHHVEQYRELITEKGGLKGLIAYLLPEIVEIERSKVTSSSIGFDFSSMIDQEVLTWLKDNVEIWQSHFSSDGKNWIFHFKSPAEAVHFKLRWY